MGRRWVCFVPFYVAAFTPVNNGRRVSCADVAPLIAFLKEIKDGTIVMMASFDDASTK